MMTQSTLAGGEPLAALLERKRADALKAAHTTCATVLAHLNVGRVKPFIERGSLLLRTSLLADASRDREEYILIGAVIANAVLAVEHQGVDCELSLLPNHGIDGVLARLTPTVLAPLTDLESRMDAVRGVGGETAARRVASYLVGCPSPQLLGMLRQATRDSGAWLDIIMDDARRTLIADILATAIHLASAEKSARDIASHYGGEALNPGALREQIQTALVELGDALDCKSCCSELQARREIMQSSLLLILGTERDTPAEWMRAGIALQRVLLLTASAGLCASVHTEIADQPEWRDALGALVFARGKPHLVVHCTPVMGRTP